MTGLAVLATVVVVIVVLFDYTNGFHDAANIIATVIASRAMTPVQAVCLVAFFEFLGPVIGGTAVANTIGGFVDIGSLPPAHALTVVLCAILGAIVWNLATWWFGIPSSSSHALVGGLIGAVVLAAGTEHVAWGFTEAGQGRLTGVLKVLVGLLLSPVAGFLAGYVVHRAAAFLLRAARPSVNTTLRRLQWLTSAWLAFSHGANDAQKSMGIITLVLLLGGFISEFTVPFWVILACATALTAGILSGGWRIVRTVGFGIYKVRPLHALDTQLTSAAVIMTASGFGAPVSTTHVVSSAIMGIGASERPRAVRWNKAGEIVSTWVVTIPGAALLVGAGMSPSRPPGRRTPTAQEVPMTEGSLLRRIRGRVFPNQPDFYGLLTAQSAFAVSTLSLLVDYLAEGDADVGRAVKHSEEHARRLRDRSMAALNDAFSTPIDREDLYRAIASLHRLVTYARTTVREMEVLEVAPDPHSLRLGSFLHDGATAVDAGYGKLGARPADAAADADAARAAERHVEKAYRLALAELFDTGRLTGGGIDEVMEVFKRREIYRHLSNAGDRVAHAGEILHDIVVKLV